MSVLVTFSERLERLAELYYSLRRQGDLAAASRVKFHLDRAEDLARAVARNDADLAALEQEFGL